MTLDNYKPGDVIYYREKRLTHVGKVGVAFEKLNEKTQKYQVITPVYDLRSGETHYPEFGWTTGSEFSQLVAAGKIKLGEAPQKDKKNA